MLNFLKNVFQSIIVFLIPVVAVYLFFWIGYCVFVFDFVSLYTALKSLCGTLRVIIFVISTIAGSLFLWYITYRTNLEAKKQEETTKPEEK